MSERIVTSYRMPLASSRAASIEIEVIERGPPARWRTAIALRLIRLAARMLRMRVRIIGVDEG